MNRRLQTSLIVIFSLLAVLLLIIYLFSVYKAHGARKQIEQLNDMIGRARHDKMNDVIFLLFDEGKSLDILQFDTINRYTNEITRIYQDNFNVDNTKGGIDAKKSIGYLITIKDLNNRMRTIKININHKSLKNDSELEKKCITKDANFKNLDDEERKKIIFNCIKEKMRQFGQEFLNKERETNIFLKPFKSNPKYEEVPNPLELISLSKIAKNYFFGGRCH